MKHVDYAILGGGAAGLSAAMRLIELGQSPLLIEGGCYPAHKVCGEFFSPSSLKILTRWGIHPIPINDAFVHTHSKSFNYHFPQPAGSLSHLTFDPALARSIAEKGAELLTATRVINIIPSKNRGKNHQLLLSSGNEISAKHLLVAAGRVPFFATKPPLLRYRAFKAHFSGIDLGSKLHMFSFPGAYLGLSPIEGNKANLACLIRLTPAEISNALSSETIMNALIKSHPQLNVLLHSSINLCGGWLEAQVPEFGIRQTARMARVYFIGDAAGTIPPACGNGLSLGIHSGSLAAEYAVQDDADGFRKEWHRQFASQIKYGKWLHKLFLNPALGNYAFKLAEWIPALADNLFALTRNR